MLICGSVCDYPRHPTTKAASLAQWSEIHQWCNSPAVPTEHQSHRLNHPSPTTILLVQPQCSTFGVVCLGSSPQWSDTICTPWNNELHQHRHRRESVLVYTIATATATTTPTHTTFTTFTIPTTPTPTTLTTLTTPTTPTATATIWLLSFLLVMWGIDY